MLVPQTSTGLLVLGLLPLGRARCLLGVDSRVSCPEERAKDGIGATSR